jgi:pimeloyl-ACP methyl ester carboxylesterase
MDALKRVSQKAKVEARTCRVNGYQVRYRVLGDGSPALLLHGWGSSWHYWQWLMPALAACGYRVYAPDLVGHGDSAKPPLEYDAETYLGFARGLVRALSLERFVLAGHSLGGYVALSLAQQQPDWVQRLVLVSPVVYTGQLRQPVLTFLLLPALGELTLRLTPRPLFDTVIRFSHLGRCGTVPESFLRQAAIDYKRTIPRSANYRFGTPDLRHDLHRVTMPSLVVWGEEDALLPSRAFRQLAEGLPDARAHPFPTAGHSPLVEQPAAFNQIVLQFLNETEN